MNFKNIPTSLRLSFFFALTMTTLLLTLNVIVTRQGRDAFGDTFRTFQLEEIPERKDVVVGPDGQGVVIVQPGRIEARQGKSPRDFFNQRFQQALFWITLTGIATSALLGALIAKELINRPLTRLQRAIGQVKNKNFKDTLDPTGLPEFDQVMTEFNELAQELQRAEQLRKNLITDTGHELKTPLAALQAQLEGMRDGVIPTETSRFTTLLHHVERLTTLTERLHEYSRLHNRTTNLELQRIELTSLVEQVFAEVFDSSSDAPTLNVSTSADFKLTADKQLLEQVFINLFTNAKAYASATEIAVEAKPGRITICDNGKGVPADALENLFERFFRVDRSRNRNHGGLGLGLAIVKEVVEAHGWTIRARDNNPGLSFIIILENSK